MAETGWSSKQPQLPIFCSYVRPAISATTCMRKGKSQPLWQRVLPWRRRLPAQRCQAAAPSTIPYMRQGDSQLLWQQTLPRGLPAWRCWAAAAVLDGPQGPGSALQAAAGAAALPALQGVWLRLRPGLGRLPAAPGAPGFAPASAAWRAASCSWAWTLQHDTGSDCLARSRLLYKVEEMRAMACELTSL